MSTLTSSFPAAPAASRRTGAARPDPLWPDVALLLAFCGFIFFYGLSAGELWRTESLRAIVAAEFLRSGNWVVPTLYGEPLLTKPPGMYAAIALASWPGGQVTEWSARLPSALAATVTVLLFYGYSRRQLGRTAGLAAAFLVPLSLMWLDKATAAEIDMLQVTWVTAANLCFLRALKTEEDTLPRPRVCVWWLAAMLCVAGGVLTKWTAPAFFYGMVVPMLWCRGRLRLLWQMPHLVGAALAAGVCLAWAAAVVGQVGWDTLFQTVSREALMRLSPHHHHRAYPWLETLAHPFKVFGATLPASVLALGALRPGFARRWDERGQFVLQAMHCWVWPSLAFWSVVPEHSVRHSFPLFPGIGVLAALVWVDWYRQTPRVEPWSLRACFAPRRVLINLVLVWLMVKLIHVHVVIPGRDRIPGSDLEREPRAKGAAVAALVPAPDVLYVFRLKDEGIMFYYGRTVRRLGGPEQLPSTTKPLYCILDDTEWRQWNPARPADALLHLADEQGAPIVLARVAGGKAAP